MRRPYTLMLALALASCSPDGGSFSYDAADVDGAGTDTSGLDTPVDYTPPDSSPDDNDADGYSPADGDCNDFERFVNPGAFDDPENGVDDDCDTVADNPFTGCDCDAEPTLAGGLDLCDPRFLVLAEEVGPAPDAAWGRDVHTQYGSAGNDLSVRAGCGYTILDTGRVAPYVGTGSNRQPGTDFYASTVLECPGEETDPDPTGGTGDVDICDTEQLVVHLRAPTNASGFSFDFIYLSSEYPEYVGFGYNDTFYAILKRLSMPAQNISYDDLGNEIEVDNAFFENPPVTRLDGTGYSDTCYSLLGVAEPCGSSTGWLRSSWNIEPGEEFTLTFSIHDEGDGIYDSMVILDNFAWSLSPVEQGTIII